VTTEQLRLRYIGAIGRHWRTSLDQSGPTPALLDDLVKIAVEHATQTPLVAAKAEAPAEETPEHGPSHRTRTRTRGGERT
jgi:hypothetical protein